MNDNSSKRLMSPWAYVGLGILYSIPFIGWVFLIIFSFGQNHINRRNFTRSYWCNLLLIVLLIGILFCIIKFTPYGEKMKVIVSGSIDKNPGEDSAALEEILKILGVNVRETAESPSLPEAEISSPEAETSAPETETVTLDSKSEANESDPVVPVPSPAE